MTIKNIKKELNNLTFDSRYFNKTLNIDNKKVYGRRSFGDLLAHFKNIDKTTTEEQLMKALCQLNFSAIPCALLKKAVFFKYYKKRRNSFWANTGFNGGYTEKKNIRERFAF